MIRKQRLMTTILIGVLVSWSTSAIAQNAVGIGGRSSIAAVVSVATTDPDVGGASTTLVIGGLAAYTTEDARFELGGGITIVGLFADFDASAIALTAQGRVNSNALGAEENIIVYLGAVAGVSFIEVDGFEDEIGIFGPKVGAEFYFSPNTAIQIEDVLVGDTEGGVTNRFTLGFKILFQ